ncbi:amidohydrolase family protein [Pseudorhodoplanes sp.]|uniref:amidohydrolase family protein n=1 Tax=Pseudorhodoplanes sp. TaxID=1934341 RepID=UPI003D0AB2A6
MDFDLILRDARIAGSADRTADIGISKGRIAAVAPELPKGAPEKCLDGRLVVPGFIETHIHLDKSCLLGRCQCEKGTLDEAVVAVAAAKRGFSHDDVYERASRTLEKAIKNGTTRMRTHVEVDPRVGLTSVHALLRLKKDYAWAIDLQLCVFPQEGLLDDPGCEDVMVAALEAGGNVVGGAPYMDKNSHGQIARIFALAQRFGIDIDFHLDFGLDTTHLDALEVCRLADETGWGGRVTIGHVTKFSAMPSADLDVLAKRLADSGVAVTTLPSTDLFLIGRDYDGNVPRGVTPVHRLVERGVNCSISTNNVLNPFTPFGDCSLVRMANLYANVVQIGGRPADMELCLSLVTDRPARLMNLRDYGIAAGNPADIVVMDCADGASAIAELAQPLMVFRRGEMTVSRPAATLMRPGAGQADSAAA